MDGKINQNKSINIKYLDFALLLSLIVYPVDHQIIVAYRHFLTYGTVTFRKVQRKSNFSQVRTEHIYMCICVCVCACVCV